MTRKKTDYTIPLTYYREYMGPSSNGMKDKALRELAGWTSFIAGWDAAIKQISRLHKELIQDGTTRSATRKSG